MQLMKPVLEGTAQSFEVTEKANLEYNHWLQQRMDESVWNECRSYYRHGMDGKNFATFPGPLTLYWWLARKPKWDHFTAAGASAWMKQQRNARVRKMSILVVLVSLLVSLWFHYPPTVATTVSDLVNAVKGSLGLKAN